jgi:hypothetical protein
MSKVIYHRHHVVPRHAGGTDDPSNITCPLTIEEHAEHHKYRYEMLGEWQDRIAWHALLGMISKQEAIRQSQSEAGRRTGTASRGRKRPAEYRFKAITNYRNNQKFLIAGKTSFLGKKHSNKTKKTIGTANSKHQKGSGNSMYGMMWITNGCETTKIRKTDLIPNGFRKGRVYKWRSRQDSNPQQPG